MRSLAILFLLLSSFQHLSANAVAGRTHILLEGRQPWWIPISGGTPIRLETAWGLPVSVATDGEHFLVAAGAEGHRVIAAMYDEGAGAPFQVLTLETESGGHAPVALWDGTRYIVAWAGPNNEARGAAITSEGAVSHFEVPGFQVSRVIASNGTQVMLFNERIEVQSGTRTIVLRAALLGPDLALQSSSTLDTTPAGFEFAHEQPYFVTIAAVPFGPGFYAVASRGDGHGNDQILGLRIGADGTVLDRTVLHPSSSGVFVDVVPSGRSLMVIFKRVGVWPVTATFVAPNGLAAGPQDISPPITIAALPDVTPSAVRLADGTLVLARLENGTGVVTPLSDSPLLPRRRVVRH
jgi:hypothetical protein